MGGRKYLLSSLARFVDGSFDLSLSLSSMMTISGELPLVLLVAFGLVTVPRFPSLLVKSGASLGTAGAGSWHRLSKWKLIEVARTCRLQTGLHTGLVRDGILACFKKYIPFNCNGYTRSVVIFEFESIALPSFAMSLGLTSK